MTKFIDKIACGVSYDPAQVISYTEDELAKIERLYDINICGNFREFMLDMGRSDGGLIGDDPIILYRDMGVRGFLLLQSGLQEEIYDAGFHELSQGKPFIFSIESETQYFYLRTASDNPEQVYHYDENNETVTDRGESFAEYMKRIVAYYNQETWELVCDGKTTIVPNNRADVICRGELLIV